MRRPGLRLLPIPAFLLAMLSAATAMAGDRPSDAAVVGITIRVEPTAEASFRNGSEFVLDVSPSRQQPIAPAILPFEVRGNAPVAILLRPSDVLTLGDGRPLGAAHGGADRHRNQQGLGHEIAPGRGHGASEGERLGYAIAVLFPAPHLDRPVERLPRPQREALLRLAESGDSATAELAFDPDKHGEEASGLVFVISERAWTENGEEAKTGAYAGALEFTVSVQDR